MASTLIGKTVGWSALLAFGVASSWLPLNAESTTQVMQIDAVAAGAIALFVAAVGYYLGPLAAVWGCMGAIIASSNDRYAAGGFAIGISLASIWNVASAAITVAVLG